MTPYEQVIPFSDQETLVAVIVVVVAVHRIVAGHILVAVAVAAVVAAVVEEIHQIVHQNLVVLMVQWEVVQIHHLLLHRILVVRKRLGQASFPFLQTSFREALGIGTS